MISSLDAILQAEKDWIGGIGGIGGWWVLQWFAWISFEGRCCEKHFWMRGLQRAPSVGWMPGSE